MMLNANAVRKTWYFLGPVAAIEALVIALQLKPAFLAVTRHGTDVPFIGWLLAAIVTLATIFYTAQALDLWPLLLRATPFKILGLLIAVPSAILEEAVFRLTVMNLLALHGYGPLVQVLVSALTFGAVHAVWVIKGGIRSLITAVLSMTVLGGALAVVYITSGRALLPCVAAHFIINLVLEPWIGYAYALRETMITREARATG